MGQGLSRESRIDRAGPNDLTNLAVDRGPTPMNIGAVLVVEDARGIDLATVRDLLGARLPRVPRLRQRLQRAPVGCGRPVWVDDPAFDLDRHLGSLRLTPASTGWAGSMGLAGSTGSTGSTNRDVVAPPALLHLAADLVCRHLPRDRPLWSAQWVTGFGDRAALVLVVHHAMADGLGGIAVLAALGDEGSDPAEVRFPQPLPGWSALAADA